MALTRPPAYRPWLALLVAAVTIWAVGPWGVLVLIPWFLLRSHIGRPRRNDVLLTLALAVIATALALTRPPGSLSIPGGIGWLTSPRYDGRPVEPAAVPTFRQPQHPYLAANGRSSMHNDGWATDAYPWPGPTGANPKVTTAFYGILECATVAFDRRGRIVGLCGDVKGPSLHMINPKTLTVDNSVGLPERKQSEESRLQDLCGGAYFYLDKDDRAVVATTNAKIAVFDTPALRQVASYDVPVKSGDCLIALMPDWRGRIWYATRHGQVGWMRPKDRSHAEFQLNGGIANSLAVDAHGLYVVSDRALVKFRTDGRPTIAWTRRYDRGNARKIGQLSQGSGTTPTLIGHNQVAITDNAEPKMNVVIINRSSGEVTCRVPVFASGHSATENSLAGVGDAVYVENNEGYAGPWTTLLGHATAPGVTKVNASNCRVEWTAPVSAPTSVPKASIASGLLYVYEKQRNAWGVNAWYLTALDLRTGQRAFRVRTGIGTLFNNHYAAISLGPDGSAYVATLAGMVKVSDQ